MHALDNHADYQNSLVRVEVSSTSINCTFLNTKDGVANSCNAIVMFGANCVNQRQIMGTTESGNLVSIKLTAFLEETMSSRYCSFIVSATAGTKVLTVEGDLSKYQSCQLIIIVTRLYFLLDIFSIVDGTIVSLATVLPVVLIIIIIATGLIIGTFVCFKFKVRSHNSNNNNNYYDYFKTYFFGHTDS